MGAVRPDTIVHFLIRERGQMGAELCTALAFEQQATFSLFACVHTCTCMHAGPSVRYRRPRTLAALLTHPLARSLARSLTHPPTH